MQIRMYVKNYKINLEYINPNKDKKDSSHK